MSRPSSRLGDPLRQTEMHGRGHFLPYATPIPTEPLTPRHLTLSSAPVGCLTSGSVKTRSAKFPREGTSASLAKNAFR